MRGAAAAALLAALCVFAACQLAWAAQSDYADSVDQALQTLQTPPGDTTEAARQAADQLVAGTGNSQTEILDDLRADPPRVGDARARLTALSRAVRSPAFTPEPAKAGAAVKDILAQPRYAGLRGGPSLGDRIAFLLLSVLVWLLDHGAGRGFSIAFWVLVVAGALCLLGALALVLRAARRGGRREPKERVLSLEEKARDRFAEADRLSAAGDLTGALRALAGAVAAVLGDDRDWEQSPLTVREIFARAADPRALRPLLVAFEAAAYGARTPSESEYRGAASAAAPFRRPAREEAA